jgi:hypothetical protein
MLYAEARPKIQTGDPLFFRGSGLLARIIRAQTESHFSHVGMAWVVGGRVLVLESRPKHRGVTIDRGLSDCLGEGVSWMPLGPGDHQFSLERALCYLGKFYGWWNAVRAGLGFTPVPGGIQCAQYASFVLGFPAYSGETPQRLFELLHGHPIYLLEQEPSCPLTSKPGPPVA